MDLEHTAIPTPAPGRWWPAAWHTALPALLSLCLGYGLAVGAPHAITPRVSVIDSNGRLHTAMMRTTVGDTLAAAGIALGPQDHVIPALEAPVPTPRRIHIVRAIPVTIQGPDRTFTIWTTADDVSGLKTHPDLKLGPHDRLWPGSGTPIAPGMVIKMARVEIQDEVTRIPVSPAVQFVTDATLPRGHSKVVTPGKPGVREQILRTFFRNGIKTGTTTISGRLLQAAVPEVRKVGMRVLGMSREMRGDRMMTMVATAYEPGPRSCGPYADGRTATGRKATYGVCAVDPRVIPLGTRLYIEGYGVAIAADTGGAIKGMKIDVCFDTVAECLRWGRRTVKVWILDKDAPLPAAAANAKMIVPVPKPAEPAPAPALAPDAPQVPEIIEPADPAGGDIFLTPEQAAKQKQEPINLLDPSQVAGKGM